MTFEKIWQEAETAARAAHAGAKPEPMVVVDAYRRAAWNVPDGPCGFAGVTFSGVGSFGRWAKKTGRARRHWPKGLYASTNFNSQSVTRAEAAAAAFAAVLRAHGITAHTYSRLD